MVRRIIELTIALIAAGAWLASSAKQGRLRLPRLAGVTLARYLRVIDNRLVDTAGLVQRNGHILNPL